MHTLGLVVGEYREELRLFWDNRDEVTINPRAKYDYYEVGGRWSGYLTTKDGRNVNQATKNEIDIVKTLTEPLPFFLVWDGQWYSKDPSPTTWHEDFFLFWNLIPENKLITTVDIHS